VAIFLDLALFLFQIKFSHLETLKPTILIAAFGPTFKHHQVAGAEGIEPSTFGFGDRRSAN